MSRVTHHHRYRVVATAQAYMAPVDTVLDIGCGIRPQTWVKARTHLCAEPWPEYLARIPRRPGRVPLSMSWSEAVTAFPEASVDTVTLLDVIEHLPKQEGRELLRWTERIARRQVIVFTPMGFLPQSHPDGIDAWGLHGGHLQEHRSGWTPDDFDDSWRCFACSDYHGERGGAFVAIRNPAVRPMAAALEHAVTRLSAYVSRGGR